MYDLGSKGGTAVNGTPVTEQAPLKLGDTLTLGGVPLVFLPQTVNIGGGGEGQPGDPHLLPDPHGGYVALRRRAAAGPLRGL